MNNGITNSGDAQSGVGNQPGVHGGDARGEIRPERNTGLENGLDDESDEAAAARARQRNEEILNRTLARVEVSALKFAEGQRCLGWPVGEFPGCKASPQPEWPLAQNRLSVPCVDRTIGYYDHRRFW